MGWQCRARLRRFRVLHLWHASRQLFARRIWSAMVYGSLVHCWKSETGGRAIGPCLKLTASLGYGYPFHGAGEAPWADALGATLIVRLRRYSDGCRLSVFMIFESVERVMNPSPE